MIEKNSTPEDPEKKLSEEKKEVKKGVIVDPKTHDVLTAKDVEDEMKERKDNPNWFREQQ